MYIKRFYRNELPNADDNVMVKITNENEYGYECKLLEYENINGFIERSELINARRIRKKHILRIDDILPAVVINIDFNKKIVSLSRKKIDDNDKETTLLRYNKCFSINKLLNECYVMYLSYCKDSLNINLDIDKFMDTTVWKLYDTVDDYGSAYNEIMRDLNLILPKEYFNDEFINKAKQNIERRIIKNNTMSEMNFMLQIIESQGLYKLKKILKIDDFKLDGYNVEIFIVSPPNYKLRVEGAEHDKVITIINNIKSYIMNGLKHHFHNLYFDNIHTLTESSYEIKFLGEFNLNQLAF